MAAKSMSDFVIFKRLLFDARPFWTYIAGILLLDLLVTPLSLLSPLPLKIVVDSVLGSEEIPRFLAALLPASIEDSSAGLLTFSVLLLVSVTTLLLLQTLATALLRLYTGEKLSLAFRSRLFWHGQTLSLAYHDTKGVSHSLYRILYDASAGQKVIIDGLISMITAFITLISMIVVIALINLKLAIVALVIVPILVFLIRNYRSPLREGWRRQKRLDNKAMSVINEVFASLRVVKAYTQEQSEHDRYAERASESLSSQLRVSLLQNAFSLATGVVTAVGTAIVLFIAVRTIQAGEMSIGDMLVVMSYLSLLYGPLKTIGSKMASMQNAFTSAERAFEFLDEDSDVPEKADALPLERAKGSFQISGVSFGYDAKQPVLDNIRLEIPPGTKVGIVGKTGAGKTTFLNLLMRFYDPWSGHIRLDGVDIKDFKIADLRRQYGLVLQEPVLFSNTIRENIAYGRPNAADEEIREAARAANADTFIDELDDGYETLVGERGMRLSGGERQRIGLARTFLRDAPILLLDEPTSSVDIETEKVIMTAMSRLMQGRTTFIIAHRLGTLDMCDIILQVKDSGIRPVVKDNLEDSFFIENQSTDDVKKPLEV